MNVAAQQFGCLSFVPAIGVRAAWCRLIVLSVGMLVIGQATIVMAQEDLGREALSNKKYPWYDSETERVQRVEMGSRPDVRSGNRNNIPVAPIKPNPTANKNWNWGGANSFFGGVSVLVWTGIGLVIALIAAVLFWAFLRMDLDQSPEDIDLKRRRSLAESIKQLPFDLDSESGDFHQVAQKFYLAKEYGKAMIYLFSHVLVMLDQNGNLRLRKGKTNRQYLRELQPYRTLADYYQCVMVPFEETFFGDKELGQEEFEVCWNRLAEFQSDIERRSSQVSYG